MWLGSESEERGLKRHTLSVKLVSGAVAVRNEGGGSGGADDGWSEQVKQRGDSADVNEIFMRKMCDVSSVISEEG